MYELMSLKLKCPKCGKSLMEHGQLIDNEPSIRLNIKCGGQDGTIWLSSIYGSYNFKSTIDLPKDEIAQFYCPSCEEEITSNTECLTCGAPMAPFYLDMGGRVSICTRSGCKGHTVEFDDLSVALKKLYQEYGYGAKGVRPVKKETEAPVEAPPKNESSEIIETGAFLQTYCPHCRKSLIEDEMLKLKIHNGEEGVLMLSPYLNVFSSKSTIFLPEDKVVSDVKCWHCDKSLIVKDRTCGRCGSPIARIAVTARTKLLDFYICTKKGCKWHGLSEEDLNEIRLEDSLEW